MGKEGSFRRGLRRIPPHGTPPQEANIVRIKGVYSPKDVDGPWNDTALVNDIIGGDSYFEPLWQEALIEAGVIPDYFVQGYPKNKFVKELKNFGAYVQIARRGIHGRNVVTSGTEDNLEALNIGYKTGATLAADKTVQRIVEDAKPRFRGENIRRFEELANKQFFGKLQLERRGIALREILNPDSLIESSGITQWYRYIAECQRALVSPFSLQQDGSGKTLREPFVDIAATVILLSHADPKIFNQAGTKEFKAAGREAEALTTKLQNLRSKTVEAFLDKDHPEHLGVVEAISQTIRSQDPRIRRATMVYLRGDTMPIYMYREAEKALQGATGLEADTLRGVMDEIDQAVHEAYPDYIVAAREFPLITNSDLKGGYGTDMLTLQRKASALLRVTGGLERDFLPDNFRWGDFKKPKDARFSIVKTSRNTDVVSLQMKFDTEQGDKTFHVMLDPHRGIIDFRNILSIAEEQYQFVGSVYHLLSRIMDRVRGDIQGTPTARTTLIEVGEKEQTRQGNQISEPPQIQGRRKVRPVPDAWTASSVSNAGRGETPRASKLVRVLEYGTEVEMETFYASMTPENATIVREKLEELVNGGLERLKPLMHEDKFSDNGNRQFEYRMGGVDGGSMGIRIIFEQIPGETGVLRYRPVKVLRKSEMQRPGNARGRNYRKI